MELQKEDNGKLKIEWVKTRMPVLKKIEEGFQKEKPFSGIRIGMTIHLEAKTAYLALVFKSGGAEVALSGSNPLSTQDDVAEALKKNSVHIYGHWGVTNQEFKENLNQVLNYKPQIIIDDGGDLTLLLHKERRELLPGVFGCCEETTTGITRIKALEREGKLSFPVIGVNDALCKHLFDNRYGTGQSTWDGILRTTNINIAGKIVVIAGYGWVGKGVALRGKGLGAKIIITEVNPVKALEAQMEGYEVMTMKEAARVGDIFITATGNIRVIDRNHIGIMKDGAILCNTGHFDVEIDIPALRELSKEIKPVRKNINQYTLKDGRRIYLLGEGRLVNLACADGHPIEIMDLSFGLQALSALYLLKFYRTLEPKLYGVPEDIDREIANLCLKAQKIEIDSLTTEQKTYINKI